MSIPSSEETVEEKIPELLRRFIESKEQRYAIVRALCVEVAHNLIPFGYRAEIKEKIRIQGEKLERRYRAIARRMESNSGTVDFIIGQDRELLCKILLNQLPLSALEPETKANAPAEDPAIVVAAIPNPELKEAELDDEGFERLLLEIVASSIRTHVPEGKDPRKLIVRRALGAGATQLNAEVFADRLLARARKYAVSFVEEEDNIPF